MEDFLTLCFLMNCAFISTKIDTAGNNKTSGKLRVKAALYTHLQSGQLRVNCLLASKVNSKINLIEILIAFNVIFCGHQ